MKAVILRKVVYKIPKTDRLTWAVILAERQGLTLLFVNKPDGKRSHSLVVAIENVSERIYEDVNASSFPIEYEDVAQIGNKLNALGDDLSEDEFAKLFDLDDL